MQRDFFQCVKCNDSETYLNVHHKVYRNGYKAWEYYNSDLVTLCEDCHSEAHGIISNRDVKKVREYDIYLLNRYLSEIN